MEELRAAVFAVPESRFASRSGDEWNAHEVMAHVVSAGAHFGAGITRILDGGSAEPAVADRSEVGAPTRTPAAWWDILERDRAALFERVLGADPDANLDRTIQHGTFGPLTWREALLFVRLHDLDHAGHLRKIAETAL